MPQIRDYAGIGDFKGTCKIWDCLGEGIGIPSGFCSLIY